MLNAAVKSRSSPHVIVVGNEKGGSGKTTIAIHIAVALMKCGQRLATIDLDSRQRTLTHYIENRRASARRYNLDLELPTHLAIACAESARVDDNEATEFVDFDQAIAAIQHRHDFVVNRHAPARQLFDAACTFDHGYPGYTAQRQFPRSRRARQGR